RRPARGSRTRSARAGRRDPRHPPPAVGRSRRRAAAAGPVGQVHPLSFRQLPSQAGIPPALTGMTHWCIRSMTLPLIGASQEHRLVAYGLLVLVFLALSFSAPASAASPPEVQEHLAAGRAAFSRGAFDTAIESWALAAVAAERAGDRAGQIQALVQASEAYTVLGRYRQAVAVLDRALKLAEASGNRADVPWVLARLGNVLIATGPPDAAEITLRRSLDMAREGGNTALGIAVLNDLGNFLTNRKKLPEAIAAYRESVTLAERAGDARGAREALDSALGPVEGSSPSREGSFLLVSIAVGYRELRAAGPDPGGELILRAARALNRAREVAEQLGDRRTTSYARGYLGALYED